MFINYFRKIYSEEEIEWMQMSPLQRLKESSKLWDVFFTLGGSLDAEPDPQSPFYFRKA